VIDSAARASESVASSAVSRALTAAVADVCAEWPHTEHGASSVGDVRTTVNAVADDVRRALNGEKCEPLTVRDEFSRMLLEMREEG